MSSAFSCCLEAKGDAAVRLHLCYRIARCITVSMARYRRNPGATFSLKYHLVWCPKFRRPVLTPPFDTRLKEIIHEVASEAEMTIHALKVMPDHVHLVVQA